MGIPSCEVERNPLISNPDRAFILRRLKAIRETRRPCLEPCLRFLLFASEDEERHETRDLDEDEFSSDEDDGTTRKAREITVALLRNNKNLAGNPWLTS